MQMLKEMKTTASPNDVKRIINRYKPDTTGKLEYARTSALRSLRDHIGKVDDIFSFKNMYDHIDGTNRKYAHILDDMVCSARSQVIVCCNRISVPLDSNINLFVINEMLRTHQFFHFSLLTTPKENLPEEIVRILAYPNAAYGEIDRVHPYSFVIVDGHSLAVIRENENELDYQIKFSFNSNMAERFKRNYEDRLAQVISNNMA